MAQNGLCLAGAMTPAGLDGYIMYMVLVCMGCLGGCTDSDALLLFTSSYRSVLLGVDIPTFAYMHYGVAWPLEL